MKKTLLASLLLTTLVGSVYAQTTSHTVNFTINGRITAKTCTVKSGGDKTINMTHKDIGAFASLQRGAKVYGDAKESAIVNCPANQTINISYTDTAQGVQTNQPYLKNTAPNPANNVGVSVRITDQENSNTGGSEPNTGQSRTFRTGSTTDFTTMSDVKIFVHPSYYVINTGVTPGDVQARMTLNISYQ